MTRNPATNPQPGDVLVIEEMCEMRGRVIQHHLAVTDRPLRVLDGNLVDGRGLMGGSPSPLRLAEWRGMAARGRFSVRAEDGFFAWGAVSESWAREERGAVLQPAPMPRGGKQPGAGRHPRVPGEPTTPTTLNLTARERARYERLRAKWRLKWLSEAMRRAMDEACEREGVD